MLASDSGAGPDAGAVEKTAAATGAKPRPASRSRTHSAHWPVMSRAASGKLGRPTSSQPSAVLLRHVQVRHRAAQDAYASKTSILLCLCSDLRSVFLLLLLPFWLLVHIENTQRYHRCRHPWRGLMRSKALVRCRRFLDRTRQNPAEPIPLVGPRPSGHGGRISRRRHSTKKPKSCSKQDFCVQDQPARPTGRVSRRWMLHDPHSPHRYGGHDRQPARPE